MSEFIGWDNYSDCSDSDDDMYCKKQKENLLKKYSIYSNSKISVHFNYKNRKKN